MWQQKNTTIVVVRYSVVRDGVCGSVVDAVAEATANTYHRLTSVTVQLLQMDHSWGSVEPGSWVVST